MEKTFVGESANCPQFRGKVTSDCPAASLEDVIQDAVLVRYLCALHPLTTLSPILPHPAILPLYPAPSICPTQPAPRCLSQPALPHSTQLHPDLHYPAVHLLCHASTLHCPTLPYPRCDLPPTLPIFHITLPFHIKVFSSTW